MQKPPIGVRSPLDTWRLGENAGIVL